MIAGQDRDGRLPRRILVGRDEPIFEQLPQGVIDNLRHPRSENALVWNLIYPLARPKLSIQSLTAIRPLWGSSLRLEDDGLEPYFWGHAISGERLLGLDDTLARVDGPGQQTEADLFLLGERNLVIAEAKHLAGLGRCARYSGGRCPEIHSRPAQEERTCRYWQVPEAQFMELLDFGPRPSPDGESPACNPHYQLGRTLLVGMDLARHLKLKPHLWLITPRERWRALEPTWLDFVERVRDNELWKSLRALAWEEIRCLGALG